jgi:hypothetical protein
MVASTSPLADRFVSPPEPLLSGRWRLLRIDRAGAKVMLEKGVIPEDATTELLDGMVVLKDRSARNEDPTRVGTQHRICVEKLSNIRGRINNAARHVESQQPLVCSETHVPEPDFMVLRGTLESYTDLPMAADAFCVIEVADSSYERDAGEKLVGYARAGVAQYIILNLRNRTAEVYTNPDPAAASYPPPQIISAGGAVPIVVGEGQVFSLEMVDVLP